MNESEQEIEAIFTVTLRSFGKPEAVVPSLRLSLARALHSQFSDESFEIADGDGVWTYEPRGDDMGHHGPEFREPLIPKQNGNHP